MTLDIDSGKKKEVNCIIFQEIFYAKGEQSIVTESQISRREFLKFLGSGAVALGLGVFGFSSFLNYRNTVNNKNNSAIAQSSGSWGAPINQPQQTSTVHAAINCRWQSLLANGIW